MRRVHVFECCLFASRSCVCICLCRVLSSWSHPRACARLWTLLSCVRERRASFCLCCSMVLCVVLGMYVCFAVFMSLYHDSRLGFLWAQWPPVLHQLIEWQLCMLRYA